MLLQLLLMMVTRLRPVRAKAPRATAQVLGLAGSQPMYSCSRVPPSVREPQFILRCLFCARWGCESVAPVTVSLHELLLCFAIKNARTTCLMRYVLLG